MTEAGRRTGSYTDSWHRQPLPPPLDGGPWPTSAQWAAITAVWLLAAWTGEATPGWRGEVVTGTAPGRDAEQWPQPPALESIAAIGGFPTEPVAAEVLISLVQPAPGRPFDSARPEAEVAADVAALLASRIPATERRAAVLLEYLAGRLTGPYTDLLRVSTGDDDLHLLHRDPSRGRTLRLTVSPAATTEPPPVLAADGADGALRTRLACLLTLLSAELWVNNNNPVTFRVWIGPRDTADPVADAASWWTRTREEPPDEPPRLHPVTVEELDLGVYTIVRGSLIDLFDGSWDGVEEWPHVPQDHLTRHLYRDLLDLLLTRTAGPGTLPDVLYTGYLPVTGLPDDAEDDDFLGTVIFVGPTDVAVLDLDLNC
ncbi:hypothetical protein [Dactylosporangium sp. NPDC000521]|uniref:hypothetical protein n=1 Tax=Dactylosporangium sp. NPDC000521 TaxID=3363975 RepID=UPI0036AC8E61